jgi:hypothetical protein
LELGAERSQTRRLTAATRGPHRMLTANRGTGILQIVFAASELSRPSIRTPGHAPSERR